MSLLGPISNRTLNAETGGFAWSLDHLAPRRSGLIITKNEIPKTSPVIIGAVRDISGTESIIHHGIRIKNANSWVMGLPHCYEHLIDTALLVAEDVIDFTGLKNTFENAIDLIVQRTLVEPADASRPNFAKWHDHLDEPDPILLTYQFSDALQTEVSPDGVTAIAAPNNSVVRMGSGITHRSQTNNTGNSLTRTWGAFLVYDGAPRVRNGTPTNAAFGAPRLESSLEGFKNRVATTPPLPRKSEHTPLFT